MKVVVRSHLRKVIGIKSFARNDGGSLKPGLIGESPPALRSRCFSMYVKDKKDSIDITKPSR